MFIIEFSEFVSEETSPGQLTRFGSHNNSINTWIRVELIVIHQDVHAFGLKLVFGKWEFDRERLSDVIPCGPDTTHGETTGSEKSNESNFNQLEVIKGFSTFAARQHWFASIMPVRNRVGMRASVGSRFGYPIGRKEEATISWLKLTLCKRRGRHYQLNLRRSNFDRIQSRSARI